MKFQLLVFLFLTLSFSAQNTEISTLEKGKPIVEIHQIIKPSSGIGVLGMKTKKAFAVYINPNSPNNLPEIINKVQFQTLNFGRTKSTVFLCIYENESGLPGKIIDKAKILLKIPAKKNNIIADLSSLKIEVPAEGYFISFEWILVKENIVDGAQTDEKPYNPTILGTSNTEENLFTLDKKWGKANGEFITTINLEVSYLPKE